MPNDTRTPDVSFPKLTYVYGLGNYIGSIIFDNIFQFFAIILGSAGIIQGFMTSIRQITSVFLSPLWGALADRYDRRIFLILGNCTFFLISVLVPLIDNAITALILLTIVTLFGTGITLPAWEAYLGDFTISSKRATMLGNINSVLTWSGNVMLLIVTIGMDIMDPTRTNTDVFVFVFLFISLNYLLAIMAGFFLPSAQERSNRKIQIDISIPTIKLKIAAFPKPLKKFLLANFLFTIAWGAGWPLFPYVTLEVSNSWFEIGLLAFVMGIAWALSQRLGGMLADKMGRKTIITWTRLALLLTPILMIFAIESNDISWIFLTNIITGLFIGGSFIAIQSLVLDLSNTHNKATLLSINNMVSGLGAFIGSTVTGVCLQFISGNEVPSLEVVSYLLFGVFLVRIVAWFSYFFIEEPVRNNT